MSGIGVGDFGSVACIPQCRLIGARMPARQHVRVRRAAVFSLEVVEHAL